MFRRPYGGTVTRVGRDLHWTRAGRGEATVVPEAGIADSSSVSGLVFDSLADFTQVVACDRAGDGSSGGPAEASADEALRDLDRVLHEAGAGRRLVLVGHSWSGCSPAGRPHGERGPPRPVAN
ncbi:alpha/beta hydrolase, partial [Streptomyces carpinensis]